MEGEQAHRITTAKAIPEQFECGFRAVTLSRSGSHFRAAPMLLRNTFRAHSEILQVIPLLLHSSFR